MFILDDPNIKPEKPKDIIKDNPPIVQPKPPQLDEQKAINQSKIPQK